MIPIRGQRRRWVPLLAFVSALLLVVGIGLLYGSGQLDPLVHDAARFGQSAVETGTVDPPLEPIPETEAPEPPPAEPEPASGQLGEAPEPRAVYPHIEVSGSSGQVKASHRFTFEGRSYRVSLEIDEALYESAKVAERRMAEVPGESRDEWHQTYFRFMVQDPAQAPVISTLAKKLRAQSKQQGLSRDRYAEFLAKYVQTMPYEYEKLGTANTQSKFPVETLVEGTGVCGDKSLLLAALLAHEGFDTSLLLFEPEKHMAVGIGGDGAHYKGTRYLFVETTGVTYISEVPKNYISGVRLESDPVVVKVGEGRHGYKRGADVARILKVRSATKSARDRLYEEASAKRLTQAEAAAVNRKLDIGYQSQFKFSAIEGREDEFLDRGPALQWIDRNCWWD